MSLLLHCLEGSLRVDLQFMQYYQTGGKEMKDLIAKTAEPAIPSVAKFLARAKEVNIHELTQLNK
jgi:hypothetical protein